LIYFNFQYYKSLSRTGTSKRI